MRYKFAITNDFHLRVKMNLLQQCTNITIERHTHRRTKKNKQTKNTIVERKQKSKQYKKTMYVAYTQTSIFNTLI